jgi:hypothetical protein
MSAQTIRWPLKLSEMWPQTEETSCDSEYTQEDDAVGLTNMVAFSLGHERDSRALNVTRSRE